jgi:single-stranded DNA-binding protein
MNAVLLGGRVLDRPTVRILRQRLLVTCDLVVDQAPRGSARTPRDHLVVRVDAWGTQGELIAGLRPGDEFFLDGRLWNGRTVQDALRVVARWVTIIHRSTPAPNLQQVRLPDEEEVIIVDDDVFSALEPATAEAP